MGRLMSEKGQEIFAEILRKVEQEIEEQIQIIDADECMIKIEYNKLDGITTAIDVKKQDELVLVGKKLEKRTW